MAEIGILHISQVRFGLDGICHFRDQRMAEFVHEDHERRGYGFKGQSDGDGEYTMERMYRRWKFIRHVQGHRG